jgi:uncharacterized protein YutE (UPF0331/DUF86 family)
MTDLDLIAKKLAFIETCLRELDQARPDLIESDIKERRFAEHTLQICIQAMQDAASHIVSDERLGEPGTNAELLTILARHGWIDEGLSGRLKSAIAFRNILVHGYTAVNPLILRDVLENRLGDLEDFVQSIRARLR